MSENTEQNRYNRVPQSNFAFNVARGKQLGTHGRIHFDTAEHQIYLTTTDHDKLVENELIDRNLFMKAFTRLMHKEGFDIDGHDLFKDISKHYTKPDHGLANITFPEIFGSQFLVRVGPFPDVPFAKKVSTQYGPPETTTRYGFTFNFVSALKKPDTHSKYSIGQYIIDEAPLNLLRAHGIGREQIAPYFEGFAKMASMADHDYLHQFLSTTEQHGSLRFLAAGGLDSGRKHPLVKQGEVHSLALHAQVCQELFSEERETKNAQGAPVTIPLGQLRKAGVLRWAEAQFTVLADMQDQALSTAKDDVERDQIREAITYLAEIYAHRLFRVISPRDPVLNDQSSPVVQACNRLHFKMPSACQQNDPDAARGMNGLRLLTETFMENLYPDIHTMKSIRMVRYQGEPETWRSTSPRIGRYPITEVVDLLVKEGMPTMKERYAAKSSASEITR